MSGSCRVAFVFVVTLIANLPALAASTKRPTSRPSERIVAEARRMLADARSSKYSHTTRVDVANGIYEFDCSGLVCTVLKKVAPRQFANVPKTPANRRPRAAEFHTAFSRASTDADAAPWRRIDRLADARAGDLIAWRREILEPGQSTGHIVIIDSDPIDEGRGVFRVTVIDSTSRGHANDTRKLGQSGIGRGTMWFKVDEAGRPVAYNGSSRSGAFRGTLLAIGRAVGT